VRTNNRTKLHGKSNCQKNNRIHTLLQETPHLSLGLFNVHSLFPSNATLSQADETDSDIYNLHCMFTDSKFSRTLKSGIRLKAAYTGNHSLSAMSQRRFGPWFMEVGWRKWRAMRRVVIFHIFADLFQQLQVQECYWLPFSNVIIM
jgi:hypothetical protein